MTATSPDITLAPAQQTRRLRVLIVGAGFSGIAMALALQSEGIADEMTIIDKAEDFGGTWRDNVYPGCACDVPSHVYSLEGEEYDWPRLYSAQPVIQEYILHVVAKHGLRRFARLGVSVTAQTWDEAEAVWHVELDDGTVLDAEVVVNGVGPLRRKIMPSLPGMDAFEGASFHSSEWDTTIDYSDKRVGIVGTGASAVQIVPELAGRTAHLTVFQRTPSWILPRPEWTFGPAERWVLRNVPFAQQVMRSTIHWTVENVVFKILELNDAAQDRAMKAGRWNIRQGIKDAELRKKVTPELVPGCKRIMFSNTFFPALDRDDVTLDTVGIGEITPSGVTLKDGTEVELDVLVYGTGFDPHHFWHPIDIVGREGIDLSDHWSSAAESYMSTTAHGFPNLFFLLGPNSGTGHNSVVMMAEAQARYVVGALRYLKSGAADWLQPTEASARAYSAEMERRHAEMVWATGCGSWYVNESGVNDTIYPGPVRDFQRRLARFDIESYEVGRVAARTATTA